MGRRPRGEEAAEHLVQVRFTAGELARLDALRQPGESRSGVVRRLLAAQGDAPLPAQPKPLALELRDARTELLRGALRHMGFSHDEIERVIRTLGNRIRDEPLADLVRAALNLLNP